MKKKIAVAAASLPAALVVVLAIHVYVVTRPKPVDPKMVAMARIDIKQPVTGDEAQKITAWLYGQQGVDHVLCNAQNRVVVFTFYPARVRADDIVKNFKASLNIDAERYVPSQDALMKSCPAITNSPYTYRIASFFRHIFNS